MKPIKNLTRFTYETAAFEGWRLAISISGSPFVKYYSDKKHGGSRKSLAAAKAALEEVKSIADGSKRVNGKLSATAIGKIGAALKA